MNRLADHSLLALGAAAVIAMLSGQAAPPAHAPKDPNAPGDPAVSAGAERVAQSSPAASGTVTPGRPRERNHAWQHQVDRPARTVGLKLTPEMVNLCMEVARDIDTDLAKQLAELRKKNVREFEEKLRRSRRLTALAELKKRDATGYNLKITELRVDATVSRLAAEARRARKAGQESEARALEQELEGQVILQLAFRYRARENYLCQLREHVERLERELETERNDFDRVLSDRMAELLREQGHPRRGTGLPEKAPARDLTSRLIVPE